MKINEGQFKKIEELICEGIITKQSASKGKVVFLQEVRDTMISIYRNNNEEEPAWVICLPSPKTDVGNTEYKDSDFPDKVFEYALEMLKHLQSDYYSQKQLQCTEVLTEEALKQTKEAHVQSEEAKKQSEEEMKQTIEAHNQTIEAQNANKWTKCALVISGVALVVSIVAMCLSTCTRTIKINDTQYQEIKDYCLNVRQ